MTRRSVPTALVLSALLVAIAAPAQSQSALPTAPAAEIAPGVMADYSQAAPGMMPPASPSVLAPAPASPTMPPSPPMTAPAADNPGTAAEQGLVDPVDAQRLARLLEEAAARASARQRGLVIPAPTLANPVATQPSAREWLMNWEFALTELGLSADRVRFEASRLTREDFAAWASRQFRFRAPGHQAIEILGPPAPDAPLSP